jgi:hypothetical protein
MRRLGFLSSSKSISAQLSDQKQLIDQLSCQAAGEKQLLLGQLSWQLLTSIVKVRS